MGNKSLLTSLLILSLSLLSSAQTCIDYTFPNNKVFATCSALPVLSSFLHWTYHQANSTVDIAYRHTNVDTNTWVAWALNLLDTRARGAQSLVAYHNSSGLPHAYTSALNSGNTTTLAESTLSFGVPSISAEYVNNAMVIYATLALPSGQSVFNQVWQSGPVSGGSPQVHATTGDNLNSYGSVDFVTGVIYQSLLELKNTSYFTLNALYNSQLYEKIRLEDCKNACLRNCSCKAALFEYETVNFPPSGGCLLLSEVFSLISNEEGSNTSVFLKVQNSPTKQSLSPPRKKSRNRTIILGSSLGALFGACLLVGSCIFVSKMKREQKELDDEFSVDKVPRMPTRFSYNDLKIATNDFNNQLGKGGFGSVFQGTLRDGTQVAVKRLNGSSQIKKSFLAEVQTIGNIHHVNLVRLIGFCTENSNRLLVYEYMSNGSLDRWIFERHQELTLGWESRRKIIADIAKGLAYLHEECRQKIYHLDVKPENILLGEKFEAKVSDFGLAKLIDKDQSKVLATLGGTPGYMAPEWLSSIITEKVDVYSFGVVVSEILSGRKNLDRSQPEEEMHLLGLFERKGEEGQLLDMVDKSNADMQLHRAEVVEMMKLAVWCLQSDYRRRPSMTVVVQVLEGLVSVQDNLDYNFINAPTRRTILIAGEYMDAKIHGGTTLSASVLSGPR